MRILEGNIKLELNYTTDNKYIIYASFLTNKGKINIETSLDENVLVSDFDNIWNELGCILKLKLREKE